MVRNPTPKCGLGSFPFARRYLGNRCFFLFLGLLRCFSSPRCLLPVYRFNWRYLCITTGAFPHSEIHDLADICSYSWLIAACHVLLRLPVPRHPPYALICLTLSLPTVASVGFLYCLFLFMNKPLLLLVFSVQNRSNLLHPSS